MTENFRSDSSEKIAEILEAANRFAFFTRHSAGLAAIEFGDTVDCLEADYPQLRQLYDNYIHSRSEIENHELMVQSSIANADPELFCRATLSIIREVVESLKPLADALAKALAEQDEEQASAFIDAVCGTLVEKFSNLLVLNSAT